MTDKQRAAREKLLAKYMKKNEKKIVTWMKRNPGLKPPIFFDIENNGFYWGEPDRQLKKQLNKEKRRLKNEVTDHILDDNKYSNPDEREGRSINTEPSADAGREPVTTQGGQIISTEGVTSIDAFKRLKEKTRSQVNQASEKTLQSREEDSD